MSQVRLLVLCTHNSARSQMAEGWLRHLAGRPDLQAEVWSAGTEKTRVKPEAIQVMKEVGIDLSSHTSKTLEEVPDLDGFDAVLTVCDSANQACPLFPGETRRYHVSVPDPSGHDLDRWREVRDQLERLSRRLLEDLPRWPTQEELTRA